MDGSHQINGAAINGSGSAQVDSRAQRNLFDDLKTRIHHQLIEKIDLAQLSTLGSASVERQIRQILGDLVNSHSTPLNSADREKLVVEVQHELFGLGPLELLMKDDTITDILVNGPHRVFIERHGKLEATDVRFRDDRHLLQIIDRIVSQVGRRIDESSPMVDARLSDGSRVNVIIPPLALDGPSVSVRRFGAEPLTMARLIALGSIPRRVSEVLHACVTSRLNILISGGTGAGKTTLLNCLSNYIPASERIVTIEDSAELKLQQPHVVRLETRPPNIEGAGTVTQRDLVRNSLRMRPDRIVVGEVRGAEALDMMQAMNTGHDGSISTVHANSSRDALARVQTMMLMAGFNLPDRALKEQMTSALDLVVQLSRLSDGTRRLVEVSEITGMEGDVVTMQLIFAFEQKTIENGKVIGEFVATGVRPAFMKRLESYGFQLPNDFFQPGALNEAAGA